MRLLFSLILLTLLLSSGYAQQSVVPATINYCGLQLSLDQGARDRISEYVFQLTASPRYYDEMVRRARIYMPFVEEAFQEIGVPDDLKYLIIQESSLRADAVSSSQAVGFWQFKEPTAREMGLRIDNLVDERSHIYRSSEAAASYLAKANWDFDNWLYAVIAYNQGLTGAVPHTDPQYYGKTSMQVSGNLHPYALKAIAHKLAYEAALADTLPLPVALVPYATDGETSIKNLLRKHNLADTAFWAYNRWVRDGKHLPRDGQYAYYVPISAAEYTGHVPDPVKIPGGGTPVLTGTKSDREVIGSLSELQPRELPSTQRAQPEPGPEMPGTVAVPVRLLDPTQYVMFQLMRDLQYGTEYVWYDGQGSLTALADKYAKRLTQILAWNSLVPGQDPGAGIIYLTSQAQRSYHIVRQGETLDRIAIMTGISVKKVSRRNLLDKKQPLIYEGQKLYLREQRPAGEKLIIIQTPDQAPARQVSAPPTPPQQLPAPPVTTRDIPQAPDSVVKPAPQPVPPQPPVNRDPATRWIEHQVQAGETLWSIATRYDTKVDIIKLVNKLPNDLLQEGQILRILVKQ